MLMLRLQHELAHFGDEFTGLANLHLEHLLASQAGLDSARSHVERHRHQNSPPSRLFVFTVAGRSIFFTYFTFSSFQHLDL